MTHIGVDMLRYKKQATNKSLATTFSDASTLERTDVFIFNLNTNMFVHFKERSRKAYHWL